MTTSNDLIDRIKKYKNVNLFLILDKHGIDINLDKGLNKENETGKGQNMFNSNYSDIPKLVEKANSVVRNIDPCNELAFVQITYGQNNYLIAPDSDLFVFCAVDKQIK